MRQTHRIDARRAISRADALRLARKLGNASGERLRAALALPDRRLPGSPAEKLRKARSETGSKLEAELAQIWQIYGNGLAPEREHVFLTDRKWRFDFAWVPQKVAVEVDGGIESGGRHVTAKGFAGDLRKLNAATCAGWRVLRYVRDDLRRRPQEVVAEIVALLNS